jgi:hypothetical protein
MKGTPFSGKEINQRCDNECCLSDTQRGYVNFINRPMKRGIVSYRSHHTIANTVH